MGMTEISQERWEEERNPEGGRKRNDPQHLAGSSGWVVIYCDMLFKPIGQQIGMQGLMVIILSKLI